jgi:hypothetical protein
MRNTYKILIGNLKEKIKFRKCLLSYSSEYFVFPSTYKVKLKITKTIILSVVLYEYETWSLMLRDEHRLRVLENREMKRIFEPKRDGGRMLEKTAQQGTS